jgi:tetratricopeptide (TPR) repeat protein
VLVLGLAACDREDSGVAAVGGMGADAQPKPGNVNWQGGDSPSSEATFVGSATCRSCHQQEHAGWEGSHHNLAMQEASDATVLGDFNETSFTHFGVETRFARDGERFLVTTDGPDGALETYEVAYVFGVYPLQQYLIAFPGGRLQVLQVCWDSRPKSEGGQRWYHLYADEPIPHTDVLHWTGQHFNWNYMCADCHSTELAKNYDVATAAYSTTWQEMSVGCEACHGAGSEHVEWAGKVADDESPEGAHEYGSMGLTNVLKEPEEGAWTLDPETLRPRRTVALQSNIQVESCAPCHSHRRLLAHPWTHAHRGVGLYDTHAPSVLDQALYHDDGQIKEEVYVYGSFVQSRMFHHGVRCSDCHDPHSLELLAPGNNLCVRCHSGKAYDSPEHHRHQPGSAGASCVNCHMPGKYYMGIDWRRDHSFRVPRPDLAQLYGTPDACTGCHADRGEGWAADRFREWYGEKLGEISVHPGLDLARARSGVPDADAILARLVTGSEEVPGMIRATAVADLAGRLTGATLPVVRAALRDEDPAVRRAAAAACAALPAEQRVRDLATLLDDAALGVRIEAARLLAPVRGRLIGDVAARYERALVELMDSFEAVNDRAASHMGRAIVLGDLGRHEEAEEAYRVALKMDARFMPVRINLAEYYQQLGRDKEALRVLEEGAELDTENAMIEEALGRFKVRAKRYGEGLVHLGKAAELAPEDARIQFFYGVALNSQGRVEESLPILKRAHEIEPENAEYLMGLVSIARDAGRWEIVVKYGRRLREVAASPQLEQLLRAAEAELKKVP